MTTTVCPNCGSARMYRSRRRHAFEHAMALLGGSMQRCHDCNSRYARFGHSLLGMGDLQGISKKVYLALTMMAAAVALMGAILWFSRAQAAPGLDTGRCTPAPRALAAPVEV